MIKKHQKKEFLDQVTNVVVNFLKKRNMLQRKRLKMTVVISASKIDSADAIL